jgi:hypothetical protein
MQSADQFMREFFAASDEQEKREIASRAPFRSRFFAPGCKWDSRPRRLEIIQSETVVNVDASNSNAVVITSSNSPFSNDSNQSFQKRYRLKAVGDTWVIQSVEIQCFSCDGKGDESCHSCHGTHWYGVDDQYEA